MSKRYQLDVTPYNKIVSLCEKHGTIELYGSRMDSLELLDLTIIAIQQQKYPEFNFTNPVDIDVKWWPMGLVGFTNFQTKAKMVQVTLKNNLP